jgi:hypothetical protein
MKKLTILFALLLSIVGAKANDGVYYTSGNQLIPITETEISVKKEVLDITRQGQQIQVHVYYEFFNPGKEKTLLVGFEALPPSGVWDITEEDYKTLTEHPNIQGFTVTINGQRVNYQVSHVESGENYYNNGKFNELSKQRELELGREMEFTEGLPYLFVYHFNATFKSGLNIVEHTYTFDESIFVGAEYCFDYVLTAANRWANNGIDDFTLNINMGDRESFSIKPTFFKSLDEWTINGVGRTSPGNSLTMDEPLFHIQKGGITFHKKNFHPEGEIDITKMDVALVTMYGDTDREDVLNLVKLQYANWRTSGLEENNPMTKEDARIMRNLPFAYRGFVFKTKSLQQFFESTNWYVPNPDYVDKLEELPEKEREWVQFWSK